MPRRYKPQGERRIEPSRKGRVLWRPGKPHPLDVLFDEASALREELPGHLEELLTSVQQLQDALHTLLEQEQHFDDTATPVSEADHVAFRAVAERFHNRKHLDHLEAVFAVIRRKRLAGRLQAIKAALDLASGLLAEEESLSHEFLSAMQAAQTTPAEEQVPNGDAVVFPPEREDDEDDVEQVAPLVLFPVEPEDAGDDEQDDETEQPAQQVDPQLSREEERVLNLTEPLTPLVTSVQQSRALLRSFEARLPELRDRLTEGNGWFDIFYVSKRHLKEEVKTFLQALGRERRRKVVVPKDIEQALHPSVAQYFRQKRDDLPIPKELVPLIFDFTEYGPYAKYRWREKKRTYTVSLGLDTDYPDLPF